MAGSACCFGELDALDPLRFDRPVGAVGLCALECVDDVHAVDDAPEHRVLAVEPRSIHPPSR